MPTTRLSTPKDLGIQSKVIAGAFAVDVVQAIATPFCRRLMGWPAAGRRFTDGMKASVISEILLLPICSAELPRETIFRQW